MGRITEIFPGRDGKIRCVEIKTSKGSTITRSVQLLHDLEVSDFPSGIWPSEHDPVVPDNNSCRSPFALDADISDKPAKTDPIIDSEHIVTSSHGIVIKPRPKRDLQV